MILTPQQVKALEDLQSDLSEVVMMTAAHDWGSVKDRQSGVTFEMVFDWFKMINSVVGKPGKQ